MHRSEVDSSYVHPRMAQHREWFEGRMLQRRVQYRANNNRQKLYIVRHGERVDMTFSTSDTFGAWMADSFDQQGNYIRKDLNMPRSLPTRPNGVASWLMDTPITPIGEHQAYLVGQGMKDAGVVFDFVYSSPSYRCVQTAHHLLRGMDLQGDLIRVEPGLFEYLHWYKDASLDFLTPQQFKERGFYVNIEYKPNVSVDELRADREKDLKTFYDRHADTTRKILESESKNVLIVAHAINLDSSTRALRKKNIPKEDEMWRMIREIPFCSSVVVEAPETAESGWDFVEPQTMPLTHGKNPGFDYRILKN